MTAEQARWLLVFQGDLFFGVALYLIFYVNFANRMSKLYVTQGELQDSVGGMEGEIKNLRDSFDDRIADHEKNVDTRISQSRQLVAKALKRERAARRLHNSAYKMLKKIRAAKGGD
jgi:hypothetical protein